MTELQQLQEENRVLRALFMAMCIKNEMAGFSVGGEPEKTVDEALAEARAFYDEQLRAAGVEVPE